MKDKKNNQIYESWDKIEPDSAAQERMLNNILSKKHNQKTKKGVVFYMPKYMKILTPIAACLVLTFLIAIPMLNQDGGNIIIPDPTNGGHQMQNPTTEPTSGNGGTIEPNPEPTNGNYEESVLHALTFNSVDNMMQGSRAAGELSFYQTLTQEEFNAIFPILNAALQARAFYQQDGSFIEVGAFGTIGSEIHLQIRLAEGELIQTMLFFEPSLQVSDVHGVPVTVIMSGDDHNLYFQADFMLDNMAYSISFTDNRESGQALMTELVNQIILGGAADLSVLSEPVVPELRNDTLTLDEARNDPDFGGFLPVNIPPQFSFESAHRFIDQSINSLLVLWHASQPRFDSVTWQVSKPTEHDLARVVSINEREKYDMSLYSIPLFSSVPEELREYVHNPVFPAEEITLDAVQARVLQSGRNNDSVQMNFSVLYGDVVITIHANGVLPEQIWEMIAEIIN